MSRTIRILSAAALLGCLLLSAETLTFSAGGESGSDERAVQGQGPALVASQPAYLNRAVDPAEEKTAPDQQETEETPSEAAAEEPVTRLPAVEETTAQTADDASSDESSEPTEPEVAAVPEPKPKRQLTTAMAALRDRVRRTLAYHHRQVLSTGENTATEIMHACLAFGCRTEVYQSSPAKKKINGITCLCWNYPCAGYAPLVLSEGRIAARIGYGLQERPSQLLAVLALSRVDASYPIRVGEDVRTVADLVEHEKLSCRSGSDLSLKLIGLAYYAADDPSWENSLGQPWSIERIIQEELTQPVLTATDGGTHRLMGLSCALDERSRREEPIDGQYARAREFIDKFHEYALALQNSDGSWGPRFLAAKGTSRSQATQLRSTGHVLGWLAVSLPEDRLEDPHVVRAVECVHRLLNGSSYRYNVKSLGTQEIGSVMHALHALAVYDRRYFKPADPDKPAEPAPDALEQAAR